MDAQIVARDFRPRLQGTNEQPPRERRTTLVWIMVNLRPEFGHDGRHGGDPPPFALADIRPVILPYPHDVDLHIAIPILSHLERRPHALPDIQHWQRFAAQTLETAAEVCIQI